jgi:hypothetical protein
VAGSAREQRRKLKKKGATVARMEMEIGLCHIGWSKEAESVGRSGDIFFLAAESPA